ncbi:MAG: GNAT family N-acetyltransferase [Candidatus Marinimicrobia bacterium]|nr:GNAT family N-acetyltransferase [Candidatus Neomarinimicrobiota bacterium]
MTIREFTVYTLEITEPGNLQSPLSAPESVIIERLTRPDYRINRSFYLKIGRDWDWIDRKFWTDKQWREYADRPELETWIVYYQNDPAGYIECIYESGQTVQIAYLGLLPQYTGRGIGSYMTKYAIRQAFSAGTEKVWLSTCSLDHPAALKAYLKCGFKIVKEETVRKDFPAI